VPRSRSSRRQSEVSQNDNVKIISAIYSPSGFVMIQTTDEGLFYLDGVRSTCDSSRVIRDLPPNFVEEGKKRIEKIFKPLLEEKKKEEES
jgi:hypothetical protein